MARPCQASLSRLGSDVLDLYLLHWPVPNSLFPHVVAGFEQLRAAGKIRAWGVSNFNSIRWKLSSASQTAVAVRPIRFLTASTAEVLSVTFFLGARITISRSWRILHSAARIAH